MTIGYEGSYHEVVFGERDFVGQALLGCQSSGLLNLVVIVVHADDLAACKGADLSCWSTDATSNVEDFLMVLDADHVGEVVFMTSQCLNQRLPWCKATEMK